MHRRGFGSVELLAAIAIVGIFAAILLPAVSRAQNAPYVASCQSNLKQLGLVCKMFANESDGGLWPHMRGNCPWQAGTTDPPAGCTNARTAFEFGIDFGQVYPEYLTDPTILVCPGKYHMPGQDPCIYSVKDDGSGTCQYNNYASHVEHSYLFLGYVLDQVDDGDPQVEIPGAGFSAAAQLHEMMEKLRPAMDDDDSTDTILEEDLEEVDAATGNGGATTIRRLREGVERFMITDINNPAAAGRIQSELPVMWGDIRVEQGGKLGYNHEVGGSNVLYMDGHVQFLRGGNGKHPCTIGGGKGGFARFLNWARATYL
ncbi:MAG: type II secretion system protein [Candidatus Hydrogenedentes bacterium]|nr:type II secretion system protein [Candidatus Hydrogenedentota bacterium]